MNFHQTILLDTIRGGIRHFRIVDTMHGSGKNPPILCWIICIFCKVYMIEGTETIKTAIVSSLRISGLSPTGTSSSASMEEPNRRCPGCRFHAVWCWVFELPILIRMPNTQDSKARNLNSNFRDECFTGAAGVTWYDETRRQRQLMASQPGDSRSWCHRWHCHQQGSTFPCELGCADVTVYVSMIQKFWRGGNSS